MGTWRNGLRAALALLVAAASGAAFAVAAAAQGPGDYQPTTTTTGTSTTTTGTSTTTPTNVDTQIALSLKGRKQKLRTFVKIRVSCGAEACFAGGVGTLSVKRAGGKRRRRFDLKPGFAVVDANSTAKLKLRIPKPGKRAAVRALGNRGKAKATVGVGAVDAAGNVANGTSRLRLRR